MDAMSISLALTCSRLVFGPLFILCFVGPFGWAGKLLALLLGVLIEASDVLDGRVARRRGEVTDLGRLLDPFADSLSRLSVFLAFLAEGYASVWAVAVILYRDVLVAYVRIWAMRKGHVQAARLSGKAKAITQGATILVICAGALAAAAGWIDPERSQLVSRWIMAGVALVTGLSGLDYTLHLRHVKPG
jgi:CDP-diacylglycerol--glycerol-3-phosphate 3-phosphatidyltransferase